MSSTAEQQARDLLERLEVEGAQSYSSGELVELANLIADAHGNQPVTRDDPALVEALINSYSILSLLHHRGACVDQPAKRTWRGKLIRRVTSGKLAGLDRIQVEEALDKLGPFAKAAERIARTT